MTVANVNVTKVLLKRGNTAQNNNYTGVNGELTIDTQAVTLRIHDGTTAGGTVINAGGVAGSYSNTNAAAYLASQNITSANIGGSQTFANANAAVQATAINSLNANVGVYQIYANANATAQTVSINAINANLGAFQSYANLTLSTIANAASQESAINSINANIGSYQTFANANAASQTTEINSLRANITAANAAITSLQSNAAVQAALLDTLTGNAATQSQVLDTLTSNAATQATTLTTLLSNAVAQQTSLIDLVANAATQAQLISNTNANTKSYLSAFDGNIIPSANVTYSLGDSTHQWKDLWISNNTIYIGNTPVRVHNGTLLVNDTAIADTVSKLTNGASTFQLFANGESRSPDTVFASNGVSIINANGAVQGGMYNSGDADWFNIGSSTGRGIKFYVDEETEGPLFFANGSANVPNNLYSSSGIIGDVSMYGGTVSGTNPNWDYLTVTAQVEGYAYVALPNDATAGTGNLRIHNDAGNIELATGDGFNYNYWYFRNDGNLTIPGNINYANGVSILSGLGGAVTGNISVDTSAIQFVASSSGDGYGLSTIRLVPYTQGYESAIIIIDPTYPNHIHIRAGFEQDNAEANLFLGGEASHFNVEEGANPNVSIRSNYYTWTFATDGNLTIPGNINYANGVSILSGLGGAVTGNISVDTSAIQFVANSSGDGYGSSTMRLIPDTNLEGTDQYLIVDPTAPGHIHIRAGGTQDQSDADLFLGGENSYVKLPAGLNPNVQIAANTHVWNFNSTGSYGELVLPAGEGLIRTNDDTISLSSFNTTTGFANIVYLGSGGGVGFFDSAIGGNWLEIFRSGTEPEIRVPVGRGNLNIQTNDGVTPYNWIFANTGGLTFPDNTIQTTAWTGSVTFGNTIAIGYSTGTVSQGSEAVAIGRLAGNVNQGAVSVAVGRAAGRDNQGTEAVSIGADTGQQNQGAYAVAIGSVTAYLNQGTGAVAIGTSAGSVNQGTHAIAIGTGAGAGNQGNSSIILNATGSTLNQTTDNTFTVKPIRNASGGTVLYYNASTGEITYDTAGAGSYGNANVATYLLTYTGNIAANIAKNGYNWNFGTDGKLTIPGTIQHTTTTSQVLLTENTFRFEANAGSGGTYIEGQQTGLFLLGGDGGTTIGANGPTWYFSANGNVELATSGSNPDRGIVFGDGTFQSTAWTGTSGNTGNVTFNNTTISTTGGAGQGIILNSAGSGEIAILDYVGVNNTNPGYWLHIGDGAPGAVNNTGNISIDYNNGLDSSRGSTIIGYAWWDAGGNGNNNRGIGAHRQFGIYKNDDLYTTKYLEIDLNSGNANLTNIAVTRVTTTNGVFWANGLSVLNDLASQSYVTTQINNLVNNAPALLDTLGEIAANLAAEANTVGSILNSISNTNANVTAANVNITNLESNAASQQTSINTLLGRVDQAVNLTSSPQFAGLTTTANVNLTANVRIHENLVVDGNINFIGNVTQTNITTANAVFTGDTYGFGALYAGVLGYTPLPYTVIQATADYNDYSQINFQNLNLSANASTEWVATAGNGTDLTNYIDFGIAGGAWDGTQLNSVGTAAKANDGWVYVLGNTAAGTGGNLVLGTTQPGKRVNILTGGPGSANVYSYFDSNGLTTANVYATRYLYANGVSILTGISGTYSNTNVAGYLAGNISTGNINVGTAMRINGTTQTIDTANGSAITIGSRINLTGSAAGLSMSVTHPAQFSSSLTVGTNSNAQSFYGTNYFYTNGVSILSGIGGTYSNVNVEAYIGGNIGSYQVYANANAAAQATSIDAINANVGAYQVYANANAVTQATGIDTINANLGAFQTYANATFTGGGSTYSNTNVAAYLATATVTTTGNITAANLIATGNVYTSNIVTTGTTSGNISGANYISANAFQVTNGIFWGNGTAWSSGGGTTYTSSGAGNITVSGSTLSLTATGPAAVAVGSSTAIPVITPDGYGRIAALSTAAVVAPAGTLTGTTLAATVVTSSLTSVGTLGSLAVTGNVTAGNVSVTQVTATTGVYGGNVTAANIITTGTYGNITGANVISANTVTVTTFVRTQAVTFAALPSATAAGAGARAFITDGNSATFAAAVSGSGANAVPVYSNGTNWFVG